MEKDLMQRGHYLIQVKECDKPEIAYFDGNEFFSARARAALPLDAIDCVYWPRLKEQCRASRKNQERTPEIVKRILDGEPIILVAQSMGLSAQRTRQLFFKRLQERYPLLMQHLIKEHGTTNLLCWVLINRERFGYKADEVAK